MGKTWNKISGYGLVFGAACVAPSVDTLSAASALAAGKMLVDIAPLVTLPASMASDSLRKKFDLKVRPERALNKILKVGALCGATALGGVAAYNIYDDVENNNKDFAHALGSNVGMPVYNLARGITTNILVPTGDTITKNLNGLIGSATGYDMPDRNIAPVFTAQSSFRARCIEPAAYTLLDGSFAALDQKITGRARTQSAQEAIDTITLDRHVYYERPPICFRPDTI